MNGRRILLVVALLGLGMLGSCASGTKTVTVIAHRGNSSEVPENTLAALESALRLKTPPLFVELDVQRTRDGKLLVIHDKTFDRTSDGKGPVGAMNLVDIRKLSAGFEQKFGSDFRSLRFNTLDEVLTALEPLPGAVMIELKAERSGTEVARLLRQRGELGRHLIAGFDILNVLAAKMEEPKARTLYLVSRPSLVQIELARRAGCSIVGIDDAGLTVEMVDAVHRSGMKVWVWTVNKTERAQVLKTMGVDGVITDYPKAVVETLGR